MYVLAAAVLIIWNQNNVICNVCNKERKMFNSVLRCNNIKKMPPIYVHFHYIRTMVSLSLLHSCHTEYNCFYITAKLCEGIYLVTANDKIQFPSGSSASESRVQLLSVSNLLLLYPCILQNCYEKVTTWPHSFTM